LKAIPFYQELKKVVESGGFEAYLVGGCVRDLMLERDIHDIDMVCLSHDYKDFAESVRKVLPSVKVEFKDNVRLVRGRFEIDISKPRGDKLDADLLKRDFTVNNLAMNFDGELFGDRSDIDSKIIRHVSDDTFKDDPLRLLRAFRFMGQLGFQIAPETIDKIKSEKWMISVSASERVYAELEKLFMSSNGDKALGAMVESGLCSEVFEGVDVGCSDFASATKGIEFFFSSLFRRCDYEIIKRLSKDLNLPTSVRKGASGTADFANSLFDNMNSDDISLRKLIYSSPDFFESGLELFRLVRDCQGDCEDETEAFLAKMREQFDAVDFDAASFIDGAFLTGLGAEAGPEMGLMIKDTRPMLASGEIDNLFEAGIYIMDKYLRG